MPSDLRLVVITCKADLACHINLRGLAQEIPLNQHIVGVRYKPFYQHITRGTCRASRSSSGRNVNSNQSAQPGKKRKDFSNQCTIVYIPYPDKRPDYKLNLKIFSNGMVVVTGATDTTDVRRCLEDVRRRLIDLSISIKPDQQTIKQWYEQRFPAQQPHLYYDYMYKHYQGVMELINRYHYQINLKIGQIINPSTRQAGDSLYQGSKEQLQQIMFLYDLMYSYYPVEQITDLLTDKTVPLSLQRLLQDIDRLAMQPQYSHRLPVTYDCQLTPLQLEVQNYNTNYYSPIKINRHKIAHLLATKYQMATRFNFSVYPGVNAKYVCRELCQRPNCQAKGVKRDTCGCKVLTYLIFQEGTIIITGARDWRQVMHAYHQIKDILTKEKESVELSSPEQEIPPPTKQDQLPAVLYRPDSNQYYLKIEQVLSNPRNYFLIKRLELSMKPKRLPVTIRQPPLIQPIRPENNQPSEH